MHNTQTVDLQDKSGQLSVHNALTVDLQDKMQPTVYAQYTDS